MMLRAVVGLCSSCVLVAAKPVSSCGGSSDHFSNPVVTVPDSIQKNVPFSISVAGTFDEDLTEAFIDYDFQLSILGIQAADVTGKSKFSVTPGLQKGESSFNIGPLTIPGSIPGEIKATGKFAITNSLGEPVVCVLLDIDIPKIIGGTSQEVGPASTPVCDSSDKGHFRDIASFEDDGLQVTTGYFDEAVSSVVVDVDLQLKALLVNVPLSLKVPVSYTPGFQPGQTWFASQDVNSTSAPSADSVIDVTGRVLIEDEHSETVACVELNKDAAGPVIRSMVSDQCLELPGGNTDNGAKLFIYGCTGDANQQWVMHGGELRYNADHSKCVDIYNGDAQTGAQLGLWDCSGLPQQSWNYSPEAGSLTSNLDTSKCMDLSDGQDGSPVQIQDCQSVDSQRWVVTGRRPGEPAQPSFAMFSEVI